VSTFFFDVRYYLNSKVGFNRLNLLNSLNTPVFVKLQRRICDVFFADVLCRCNSCRLYRQPFPRADFAVDF